MPGTSGRITSRRKPSIEVRRRGRALVIDDAVSSWYEPGLPVTRSVWDAMAAPLLFLPPARRRKVLILGLGGGSVARVARALAPRAHIVGVEMSREVLRAGRRWLPLDGLGVEIVQDDARAYLGRSRQRYDVIVDDVFVGRGRTIHKPDWLPFPGLELARRRLAPGGLLVSNTIDEFAAVAAALRDSFAGLLSIGVEGIDNRVVVAGGRGLSARRMRAALQAEPLLRATLPNLRLRTLSR